MPQSPQLALSEVMSLHEPLHDFWPVGHAQTPARHSSPLPMHGLRQLPHETTAWVRSTQNTLQKVIPAGQTHWPAWQLPPGPHWFPQTPQFVTSVARLTQPAPVPQ